MEPEHTQHDGSSPRSSPSDEQCPHRCPQQPNPGPVTWDLSHIRTDGPTHRASASSFNQDLDGLNRHTNNIQDGGGPTAEPTANNFINAQPLLLDGVNREDNEALNRRPRPPSQINFVPQPLLADGIDNSTPTSTAPSYHPTPLASAPPTSSDHETQPTSTSAPTMPSALPAFNARRATPPLHPHPTTEPQTTTRPMQRTSPSTSNHSNHISRNRRRRRFVRWLRRRFRHQTPWLEGWIRRRGRHDRRESIQAIEDVDRLFGPDGH